MRLISWNLSFQHRIEPKIALLKILEKDETIGIMIRGIQPLDGLEAMIQDRGVSGVNLSNGPAKLTQALGITMKLYGQAIRDSLHLVDNTFYTPLNIISSSRIGIPNKGEWTHKPLRYYLEGNPYCTNMKKSQIRKDYGWK